MRFYFETYGCTTNRADTDIMKGVVLNNGHDIVENIEKAEVVVVNTCIVIGKTENKMLNRIREISKGDVKLVVSGCLSSTGREKILDIDPNIEIFTPDEPGRIAELIDETPKPKFEAPSNIDGVVGRVQISEGCLGNCSYCITKYARGKLRSFPEKSIIRKIESMVDKGTKEIRLTAQDTGVYGKDTGSSLVELLSKLSEIQGDFKIRVGMMNPASIKQDFGEVFETLKDGNFYRFIHLPVQSGSEKILDNMNRNYKPETFIEMVREARKKLGATVSTDVITGFPGESSEDFEKTIDLLQKSRPDIINITRYSERPGTEAEKMKHASYNESKKRSKKLTELRNRMCGEKRKNMVGDIVEATVMEEGKPGTMIARDKYYNPIVVKKKLVIGEKIDLKIKEGKWSYLVGEVSGPMEK